MKAPLWEYEFAWLSPEGEVVFDRCSTRSYGIEFSENMSAIVSGRQKAKVLGEDVEVRSLQTGKVIGWCKADRGPAPEVW